MEFFRLTKLYKMKALFLLLALVSLTVSCKKTDESGCWECKDALGNPLQTICADNEQEAFDNSGTIGGTHDINTFRQYCHKK